MGGNKESANLPVMFFIHGGGFNMGSGSNATYGSDFLTEQDVILVTTNYRLGPLGFLDLGEEGATGNNGFKDQQMALKWTKKNCRAFGGNPNLITIFGQSAG